MASLPQAPLEAAHPRPGVRPAPPAIAHVRRRRRPSGEPPPLPRHLNASGKWWLGSSAVVVLLWGVGAVTGSIALVDLVDTRVLQAISEVRSPGLTRVAEIAGGLATPAGVQAVWLVNMVVLVAFRRWRHLLVWLGVVLLVTNLADAAATTLQRPRAYEVEILGPWSGFAMPSVNAYYFLFLALCGLIIFVSIRLQHSRLGRAFVAIREDEIAAKAMGINTRNVKLLAFALGASFGGVSGAMFASFQGFISPESFSLMESIAVLAMVVLGGIGHIPGVVLGGVILAALPEVLRHVVEPVQRNLFGAVLIDAEVLRQLLYGLAMVVIMLYRPSGLWPSPKHEDRLDANAKKRLDEKEPAALAA